MRKTLSVLAIIAALGGSAMAENWFVNNIQVQPFGGDMVTGHYTFYVINQHAADINDVATIISSMSLSEFTATYGSGYACQDMMVSDMHSGIFAETSFPTTIPSGDIWGVGVYQNGDDVQLQVVGSQNPFGNTLNIYPSGGGASSYTPFTPDTPTPILVVDFNTLKSMTETRTDVAALVNSAADFMATTGVQQAKLAAKVAALTGKDGAAPFVALGGSSMRYNTGSHVNANGLNAALGVAKTYADTTFGIAGEYGISDYKSYVGSTNAKGDSKLYGAAALADWQGNHGWHAEGALRLGRTSTDYSAMTALGHTHYTDHASYQGVMLGGGKEMKVSKKSEDTVDLYARYLYSHTNGSNTTATSGESMHFSGVQSHRTMVGARYNHELCDSAVVYAGAAWMHEFDGDAHSVIGGFHSPSPSLKGDSCMVEIGTTIAPFDSKNVLLNLNVQGWSGVQRGISGGAGATIKF